MQHEIESQWMGRMQFNALIDGHTVVMDAPERAGGADAGPIPKPLILTALSGCSGMDVIAILRKKGIVPDDFNIRVAGVIGAKQPIEYTAIQMVYEFRGNDADAQASIDAVTDSQEKYCGVSSMLKKILPLTWEIRFNGRCVFSNEPSSRCAGQLAGTVAG